VGGGISAGQVLGAELFIGAVGNRLDGSPLALMFDIDGTLAPIAPTPADAGVPEQTRNVLRRLAVLPRVTVVLVSGRSAEGSWKLAGVTGAWVIGNHGLELRTPDGEMSVHEEARRFEPAVAKAARTLKPMERAFPGAIVEDKRWTLSLHYRLVAPDAAPVLVERARQVADAMGLRVTEGKKIVELRPPVTVDKGTAAVAFAERHGALRDDASAMYAGDDRTDEDAFRQLRERSSRAVTARIVGADDRAGEQTHAEFALASPDELRQVLDWLAARRGRA
jgi:trehalose 6-phosphate phosphatase